MPHAAYPIVRSHLLSMSQWNFRESTLISQVDFVEFKEYFKSLCRGDDSFIDHYFRKDKFEFFWRSKMLLYIPSRFPGIQITVKNLNNGTIEASWKTPPLYLLIWLALVILSFTESLILGFVLLSLCYFLLFVFYKIGTSGLKSVIEEAIRYSKRNET